MGSDTTRLSIDDAMALAQQACLRAGAGEAAARSLARAIVDAEVAGQSNVGLAHLIDHLDALRVGRIVGNVVPVVTRPAPAFFCCDAGGGIAQLGFDTVFEELAQTARRLGIALFAQHNAYTCGALGWFASRLADEGLVAIAATNGPALLAGSGGTKPVYCTNPLAFAAPRAGGSALLIDQASSETAFVNVRQAAREGRAIPQGWALDADGNPTTDAKAAVKGALLAFGGARGANVALMVEVLAAGLTGANWSLDAPSFVSGSQAPGSGLLVIAIEPKLLDPDFEHRLDAQLERLDATFSVHIPGRGKAAARHEAQSTGLQVDNAILARLQG